MKSLDLNSTNFLIIVGSFNNEYNLGFELLYEAIDRQVVLDTEYPNIYNQVVKHYEEKGVDFYGDVDEDYDILLTKLEQDLFYYEPSESSS